MSLFRIIINISILLLTIKLNALEAIRYTENALLEKYTVKKFISGGGEAYVYEVKDKTSSKSYALVIRESGWMENTLRYNWRGDFFKRMMENQNINPHQATIIDAFLLERRNYSGNKFTFPFKNVADGRLFNNPYEDDIDAPQIFHEAILMEMGINCLAREFQGLWTKNTTPLFIYLSNISLAQAEIKASDDKDRNYIFIPTRGHLYQGQDMADFDYWSYKIDGTFIFVETPSHILKRIDFGGWALMDQVGITEALRIAKDELKTIACRRPAPDSRILSIKNFQQTDA